MIEDAVGGKAGGVHVGVNESDSGPRPWVVVARFGDDTHTHRFADLDEAEARAIYDKLVPVFEALMAAEKAARQAVKQVVPTVTRREDRRHIFTEPEPHVYAAPGPVSGVDFGRPIMLLAQEGDKELWWLKSGSVRSGWHNETIPTELRLCDRQNRDGDTVCLGDEGGRLSKARLAEHAKEIDEFFGWDISQYLAPGRTIRVKPTPAV